VLVTPFEVAVAPSPATPAKPTAFGSSEELWVDEGVAVEKTVDNTVDWPSEMVTTDPLAEEAEARLSEARVEDGGTTVVWPLDSDVVKGSSDLVMVWTSPFDWVARNKMFRSIEELESVACESVSEVEDA
jgi:hypothetical protein